MLFTTNNAITLAPKELYAVLWYFNKHLTFGTILLIFCYIRIIEYLVIIKF